MLQWKQLGLFLCLLFALTSCAREESPDMIQEYSTPVNPLNPHYYNDYGGETSYYGGEAGLSPDLSPATGAGSATGMSATEEVIPTASWSLMKQHGEYHATSKGRVYSYGEKISTHEGDNFWEDAKGSLDDLGDDLLGAVDKMK